LDSYSEYLGDVTQWWNDHSDGSWYENRLRIMDLLQKEVRLQQIVKLVGPDALPDTQNFILEVCSLFKTAFLQQNAFDEVDRFCSVEKQVKMLAVILAYYEKGMEAINKGVPMVKIRRLRAVQEMARMRLTVKGDELDKIDKIQLRLERSIDQIGGIYEN
jgi:V/A-type H+-transporting ATPase subunit A